MRKETRKDSKQKANNKRRKKEIPSFSVKNMKQTCIRRLITVSNNIYMQ